MKKLFVFPKQLLVLLSILALVFPAACTSPASSQTPGGTPAGSSPAGSPTKTVAPSPSVSSTPTNVISATNLPVDIDYTIHIEDPLPFTLVQEGDITLTVKTTNIQLVEKFGQPPELFEGHIDWYMDVDIPTTAGEPAIPKFGNHAATTALTYTWKNVPVGTRQFAVQLTRNDHSPFQPPVIDSIILTVVPRSTGPAVFAAYDPIVGDTSDPYFIYNPIAKEVTVAVNTRNFQISGNIGMANQSGQGHYIYYMDVDVPTDPTKPAITDPGTYQVTTADYYIWKNVEPGFHSFYVQLVNNDNTPLNPPAIFKAVISAQALPTASPTVTVSPSPTSK